jgi:hypothetical protein
MNSLSPDHNMLHMPAILCELKSLAAQLRIQEMRAMADSALSMFPHSQSPNTAKKKSNSPPPNYYYTITTTSSAMGNIDPMN